MNKFYFITCLFALMSNAPVFADSPTPPLPMQIHVQADSSQYDFVAQQFQADGNVRISYGDKVLTADSVSGNPWTGEVEASGGVVIHDSTGSLTGNSLKYSFITGLEPADTASNVFSAIGNVHITRGQISLTADSIIGNQSTGEIEASGNVSFRDATRNLNGNSFKYNFKTDIGDASDATAAVGLLHFRGKELKAAPNRYEVNHAIFSTCDRAEPHYYLSAQELIIEPGKQITAKQVTIVFLGHRLITIPKYKIKLVKKKSSGLPLPDLAFSGQFGLSTGIKRNISSLPQTSGTLDVRFSTKQVILGGLMYDRIMDRPIFARLSYRLPYYDGTRSDTMLTRLPEIGARFCSGEAAQSYDGEREALRLSRDVIDPFDISTPLGKFNVVGEIGAGKFIEDPGHISYLRTEARAIAWMDGIPIDGQTTVIPSMLGRLSAYDSGDTYSVLGLRLAVARKLGDKTFASIAYVTHAISGKTPFTFDAIDLPNELSGRVEFPVGDSTLGVGVRYDLTAKSIYETEISVAKPFHCLEPKLTWSSRFKGISMGMGLTGL